MSTSLRALPSRAECRAKLLDERCNHQMRIAEIERELAELDAEPSVSVPPAASRPLLVGVPEAAALLGIGERTVYDLIKRSRGQLRLVKQGSRSMLKTADLESYVEGL